jgi:hypothetical protein
LTVISNWVAIAGASGIGRPQLGFPRRELIVEDRRFWPTA